MCMSTRTLASGNRPGVTNFPGAGLAKFFEHRGRRIFEGCGVLWYSVPNGFLVSLPYQQPLDPLQEEVRALLRSSGAAGVRFSSLQWHGIEGGVYLHRGRNYTLQSVNAKHRPRVRKGMETFEVRQVPEEVLLQQGIQLNYDTMRRQNHYDPEFGDPDRWARLVKAIQCCPAISAVGVFAGDRLASYMITCREDGWLNILHQMSRLEDLKLFPNHYLTYWVTKAASEDPSLEGCSYGLVPLIANEGLHEYKTRFGYTVSPRNCAVVLGSKHDLLLNNAMVRRGVRWFRCFRPNDQRLETIDTVLRGAALTSHPNKEFLC